MAKKLALGQRYYNYGFTDSVLFSEAYMRPRYKGSKLIAKEINKYTDYTQLTAEEYQNRMGPTIIIGDNKYSGIRGFIKTTKPIDGSFPPLFEFFRDPALFTFLEPYLFKVNTKGNLISFPLPGNFTITGVTPKTPTINSYKDVFKQDGTLNAPPADALLKFGIAYSVWESQYMGGYRRDRSYGKLPVIEVKTNTIYEFDWGGSAYPEVEKGGSVHLKQIINVDSYNKNTPQVYIVNEATNDSQRIDSAIEDGLGVSIVVDNPNEETDFQINLKRSLAYGDRITLDQYSQQSVLTNLPIKNVIALEPGIGVPSYGGIYTQGQDNPNSITASLTGEVIKTPYLPAWESGHPAYVAPGANNPRADFYIPHPQNPSVGLVLASTVRNISGSYYVPTDASLGGSNSGTISGGENPRIQNKNTDWKYLKIDPVGRYTSGSSVDETSVHSQLSASLANNNRHFVSFYSSLGNLAVGDLNQIGEPIEIKSVSLTGTPAVVLSLKNQPPVTGSIGLGDIGILVWKAQQGAFAVMKPTNTSGDFSYSNLKEGGFYRQFSTKPILKHFKNIVETVGIKPST